MDHKDASDEMANVSPQSEYEPPHIEAVLTPEALEREVLYAGGGGSGGMTQI